MNKFQKIMTNLLTVLLFGIVVAVAALIFGFAVYGALSIWSAIF